MKKIKLFGMLLPLFLLSSAAIAANYPVNLEYRQTGEKIHVLVHNQGPSPVSVRVGLSNAVNIASDRSWPIYHVVPANSSETLASLSAVDTQKDIQFKTSMDSMPGLFDAEHDRKALYRLPYRDGERYVVGQAPGGRRTTHNAPINQFAVDFEMPEGAAVVAARDGLVVQTEDRYAEGGKDSRYADKANYVRILHADGTAAVYAHLMHRGVTVEPGQAVKAGAVIGYSGSTGYSGGPHLHFAVTRIVKTAAGFEDVSVPVSFYVGNPARILQPQTGLLLQADYTAPLFAWATDGVNATATPSIVGPEIPGLN